MKVDWAPFKAALQGKCESLDNDVIGPLSTIPNRSLADHHQLINVLNTGAQAFLMDYT
jgi:hypothetical protein